MRKIHLILTIGGGFFGIILILQIFIASTESNPGFYALLAVLFALYGYGVFAGLRFADFPEDKKHLIAFYWLQVPWISTPIYAYRFVSGFHISVGYIDSRWTGFFPIGSNWQLSFFQSTPWGIGVNFFALVMVILLMMKKPIKSPDPTSSVVMSDASTTEAPSAPVAHL